MDTKLFLRAKTYRQLNYAYHKRVKKLRDPATLKTNMLRVRLTDQELNKLQHYADSRGWSLSQVIHEYIHRLPNPKEQSQKTSE